MESKFSRPGASFVFADEEQALRCATELFLVCGHCDLKNGIISARFGSDEEQEATIQVAARYGVTPVFTASGVQ